MQMSNVAITYMVAAQLQKKEEEEEGKPWKEAQKHNMIYAMWFGGAF